ncbi:MAG TPA: class I SAM-dependent methyltransferase [Candidatus Acidoferrales bacterium]|nr:class I SAM-dependent methyltransferase [Candidatus Acidoferrales bacterium]
MSEFSEYFDDRMKVWMEYTNSAKTYIKSRRRYRDTLELVFPFLKQGGKSVLDLGGCEMAFLCAPLAGSVLSVSLGSHAEAAGARFSFPVRKFDIMDPIFPLEGQTFDVVFFLETLEHLPPPTDVVMKRLRGLVKPDGLLLLSVPNMAFWQKRIKFFVAGRSPLKLGDERDPFGGYHHIRTYTYDECVTLLERYGFKVLRCVSGNYQRDFRSGWFNYPFHVLERAFPRIAHKLMFLAAPR